MLIGLGNAVRYAGVFSAPCHGMLRRKKALGAIPGLTLGINPNIRVSGS